MSRGEILGMYGVPPHLGGDTEKQTSWGTGIEQMDIGYAKHTITPWCVRIEQELNRKLFPAARASTAKPRARRADARRLQEPHGRPADRRRRPWLTRNEAREIDDWNESSDPAWTRCCSRST
jgi:phage portal protein BeeE